MPRLFTGLELPLDVALDLSLMRGGIEGARWISPDNYHITLRFAGDMPERAACELMGELGRIVTMPAFRLSLAGMGVFGTKRPHSLYVKVAESADLRRLQAMHERICKSLGMAPETRKFIPHVTLARLNYSQPEQVQRFASARNLYRSREFDVEQFVLFSAREGYGGGPYGREHVYDLSRAAS
ncbi:MAG: RNA 2',3'-cyclic phosphodiesterase [Anderseniella sp.]|jgi:RNA 2',3'-cyclic 3'-phosphodiesterase